MEEIMQHLDKFISYAEQASPIVWEALIKQQWTIAVCYIVAIAIFFFSAILSLCIANSKSVWDDLGGISFVISVLIFVGTIILFLIDGLPRLLNPTYYAIKALMP